jgi:hypothetical protein
MSSSETPGDKSRSVPDSKRGGDAQPPAEVAALGAALAQVIRADALLNKALAKPEREPEPWWRSPVAVPIIAAIIALVPVAITTIAAKFENDQKLDLATQQFASDKAHWSFQQDHAAQAAFFEKAVDPTRPTAMRVSVLKYLSDSPRVDADIKKWATDELPALQKIATEEAAALSDSLAAKVAQRNAAAATSATGTTEVAARQQTLAKQDEDITRLERDVSQVRAASVAVGKPQAVCDFKQVSMYSDLKSGIGEAEGTSTCQATATGRAPGERWIARAKGRAFECKCES